MMAPTCVHSALLLVTCCLVGPLAAAGLLQLPSASSRGVLSSPPSFGGKRRTHALLLIQLATSSRNSVEDTIASVVDDDGHSKGGASPPYLAVYNTTLTFPPYSELMQLCPGEFVTSETFVVSTPQEQSNSERRKREHRFLVKLYPRGGGHVSSHSVLRSGDGNQKQKSGFGMSYKVLPPDFLSQPTEEKVGAYLQYVPDDDDGGGGGGGGEVNGSGSLDASFSLRLVGKQRLGRRFDVLWRAGMRFVALSDTKLSEGRANDFGAHLMQTAVLPDFLGIEAARGEEPADGEEEPVQMQVSITVHESPSQQARSSDASREGSEVVENNRGSESLFTGDFGVFASRDARQVSSSSTASGGAGEHDAEQVRAGRVVVPVLSRLSQRPKMFQLGVYPGVEYRILRTIDPDTDQDIFYSKPGADYELKPIYPLVTQLERPWPVRVNERDIPKLLTPAMYNAVSAIGSLVTAATGLALAFVVSQAVSLFVIPTRSMDPTLQVGDVLLVDKLTPRLFAGDNHKMGDVVLFHPPKTLRDIVGGAGRVVGDRDLFVKRVAAEPGDRFAVDRSGSVKVNGEPEVGNRDLCTAEPLRLIERYIRAADEVVPEGSVAVMGDCSSVSIDSRVWGSLPTSDIVGKPLVRIWPMARMGPIPPLPTVENDWTDKQDRSLR